eukprot:1380000-Amorphochlora_amoeboformis.AAC.1
MHCLVSLKHAQQACIVLKRESICSLLREAEPEVRWFVPSVEEADCRKLILESKYLIGIYLDIYELISRFTMDHRMWGSPKYRRSEAVIHI